MAREREISGVAPCLAAKLASNSCPKFTMIHMGGAVRGKRVKRRLLHARKRLYLRHGLTRPLFKFNICE